MIKKIYIPIVIITLVLSACDQGIPVISIPTNSSTPSRSSTPTNSSIPSRSSTPTNSRTTSISSGLEGQVTEGPMCPGPIRIGDTKCQDQPYQATITILDSSSIQITQIQTDENGYFKIPLAPGVYILHPISGKPLPRASDQTVEVSDGQFTHVTIMYDTGMR